MFFLYLLKDLFGDYLDFLVFVGIFRFYCKIFSDFIFFLEIFLGFLDFFNSF